MNATPCLVNGTRQRIMEVGMQSAYIDLGPNDRAGDEVILVGEGLSESDIATDWEMGDLQTLHLARCGQRTYAD